MPKSNDPTVKDLDRRNGRPKRREKSHAQIATAPTGLSQPELPQDYPKGDFAWFTKVRDMRVDPTIALIRDIVIATIVSSDWAVGHTEDAPEGSIEFIQGQMFNIRGYVLENILTGWMDFGWQCFEKVWGINNDSEVVLDKIKPLIQDGTRILVSEHTGEYLGIAQNLSTIAPFEVKVIDGLPVFGSPILNAKDTLLSNVNVEGTYWYGRPIMENALCAYDGWNRVNSVADRYDTKIAGSYWIIHYPEGTTDYKGSEDVDNFVIAQDLIAQLTRSSAIAIPKTVDKTLQELNEKGGGGSRFEWEVELLSDSSSQQGNFIERLSYYDHLKVRAFGFPERSILQGKFGTKADAESHADFAIQIQEFRHKKATEHVNYQLVDDLLRYNYGTDAIGSVYLKTAPIADDSKRFLQQVYIALLQNDVEAALEKVDRVAMQEKLGIEINTNEDDENAFHFKEPVMPPAAAPFGQGNDAPAPGDKKPVPSGTERTESE